MAHELNIDYQLDSGSALGAVKLQNFIPWDIDIDIYLRTKDIDLFKPGGPAYQYLTSKGIEIYRFQRDNYSVKNAGSFNMWYGGITVEMLGSLDPLSRSLLPSHLRHAPTRVQVTPDTWIPVPAHPGLYARGRYGPGYLFHVQSWRHVGMSGSFENYSPGAWQACPTPGHQACLNNYPIQGNMELIGAMYP